MVSENLFPRKHQRETITVISDGKLWRWQRSNGRCRWESRCAWADYAAALLAAYQVALATESHLRLEVQP